MDRAEKEDVVTSLHKTFEDSSIVVVTHYSGMTVAELSDLRMQMRDAGASFKVTKNRLTLRALEGTKYQPLDKLFTGPTAIAYSDDPVAAAKVAVNFAKDNDKLIVLGGALGDEELDIASIKSLASLPSMDELRAKIVGMINTPATRIAGVLQAPAGQIARVIGAHSASGGAA
ncbi:MAG: 50S ribosomal protein L10 [Alphaproteobacteria bacterium]|nr:50S ribosomal protein L10 [Alphaproteobacteria bacterium]MBT7943794.1 50S ribosomal protein L10 [Alphaproteobacteria bacterium]